MSKKIQNVSSSFRIDNEIWFHQIRKLSFDFVNKHYDEIQKLNNDALKKYSISNSLFTDLGRLQHNFQDGKLLVVHTLEHTISTIRSLNEIKEKRMKELK